MASNLSAAKVPPLPFIDLQSQRARIGPAVERAMAGVLAHGQYILGPEVEALETALAGFAGVQHVVTCANGTDALMLVMMAEGVGAGDAVFVPSFTFIATGEPAATLGATLVFVDVVPETFNIDPDSLARAVQSARGKGLRPRMVVAVDLFGLPAPYAALRTIADEHRMTLVADAAQSFGAEWGGRKVGTFADYTTTSFFPAKPLGCYGDGGAVLTDDSGTAEVLRSLRLHGKGTDKYDNVRVGLNSRLDTLQAAILIEKLKILPDEIAARNIAADRYGALLSSLVTVPKVPDTALSVWAQYTVLLPRGVDRAHLQAECKAAGVPTAIYYPIPMHAQSAYAHFPGDPAGLPVSEELARRALSLPMHPYLDAPSQRRVAEALECMLAS